jgi:hypothetical protein
LISLTNEKRQVIIMDVACISPLMMLRYRQLNLNFLQPRVKPVDEYGALVYVGRWGIYGVSLPGRVTFSPGNTGYATFGAPRPQQVLLSVLKHES